MNFGKISGLFKDGINYTEFLLTWAKGAKEENKLKGWNEFPG